jgi:hypothetical protein
MVLDSNYSFTCNIVLCRSIYIYIYTYECVGDGSNLSISPRLNKCPSRTSIKLSARHYCAPACHATARCRYVGNGCLEERIIVTVQYLNSYGSSRQRRVMITSRLSSFVVAFITYGPPAYLIRQRRKGSSCLRITNPTRRLL